MTVCNIQIEKAYYDKYLLQSASCQSKKQMAVLESQCLILVLKPFHNHASVNLVFEFCFLIMSKESNVKCGCQ